MNVVWTVLLAAILSGGQTPDIHFVPTSSGVIDAMLSLAHVTADDVVYDLGSGEGDIVIFSPAATPRSGDDCFVGFAEGHTTFKRAFFESDKGEAAIRLQPRNERYRAQMVRSVEITGLYKAVFKYQKVDEE